VRLSATWKAAETMLGSDMRAVTMATIGGWLALWSACGAAMPPVPGKGGPAWIELASEHFTVWTDAPPDRGRELIREMERLRQIVVGVVLPGVPSSGRDLVIAFRDDDELSALSPTGEPRAYAMPAQSPLWQPAFVLSAFSNRDRGDRTVAHELTHAISYAVVHHQPRWLAEGMAEYFETVELDPDRTTADIGVAPQYRGQPILMAHLMPVAKLFAWAVPARNEDREYSTAWALFTFLINEHRAELGHYMQLLDSSYEPTSADRTARAWSEAFPSLPLSTVDGALQQWLVTGHHLVLHVNVQLQTWPIAERGLADADVYALRGLLHAAVAKQEAQAHQDVAAALAAEPTNVLARLLTVMLDHAKITPEDGRALTVAHADDWRAWLLATIALSGAHGDEAEIQAARERACRLIAANPALVPPAVLCLHETGQ
jgi:hypothetical protein